MPGEFELIAHYFAPLSLGFSGAYGLRDDAAVIAPAPGCELVAKTDAIVGGIDFPQSEAADLVARKALRVNLSDLAAKGAVPRAYMLDLILPAGIDEKWIAAFADGLRQDQAEYRVHLIGGDMSSTPGPITIAVMAFGDAPVGRIIRRGGARLGDAVYVTGTVGDAALRLSALRGALAGIDPEATAFLVERYQLPLPRVALGPKLVGLATASIDVSDGLVADLHHICEVSNLAAMVDSTRLPLSDAARTALIGAPALLATALTGGDDYEILFTAPPDAAGQIAELSHLVGTSITRIAICGPSSPASRGSQLLIRTALR